MLSRRASDANCWEKPPPGGWRLDERVWARADTQVCPYDGGAELLALVRLFAQLLTELVDLAAQLARLAAEVERVREEAAPRK